MVNDNKVYLDDIYASEECDGSAFRAVVMMSKEARYINDQAKEGFIQLNEKPTTVAMHKFKTNRLVVLEEQVQVEE